jgi:hypothetical protein
MYSQTVFQELVDVYSQNILVESQMDKDDIFDREDRFKPVYEMTAEDTEMLSVVYLEAINEYKQCLEKHMSLEVERANIVNSTSLEPYKLYDSIRESHENIEGFIKEFISYRDVLGYNPALEQKAFGLEGYLEIDSYPPTFENVSEATFLMLSELVEAYQQREQIQPSISDFDAAAMRMFDGLNDTQDHGDITPSENALSREQRDQQLATDCRQILEAHGQEITDFLTVYEQLEGTRQYRFTLDLRSEIMALEVIDPRSTPLLRECLPTPLLVESQGEIIESGATDFDVTQIHQTASEALRDLHLARDCREILKSQGEDYSDRFRTFERPDGEGKYRITLDIKSDTLFLQSKDSSTSDILIESKGKIIESKTTNLDAAQIGKAASALKLEQSKQSGFSR